MSRETGAGWPYNVLELDEKTTDRKTVKRAYAKVLKRLDQQADADAFQELRGAYEYALQICAGAAMPELPQPTQEYVLDGETDAIIDVAPTHQQAERIVDPRSAQWRLIESIHEKSIVEDDEPRIRRIFSKLDLDDPVTMQAAEQAVIHFLEELIETNDFGIFFPGHAISRAFVHQCNQLFGWLDDVTGWQSRQELSPEFIMAVDNCLSQRSQAIELWPQRFFNFLLSWRVWVGWFALQAIARAAATDFAPVGSYWEKIPVIILITWPVMLVVSFILTISAPLTWYLEAFAFWVMSKFSR